MCGSGFVGPALAAETAGTCTGTGRVTASASAIGSGGDNFKFKLQLLADFRVLVASVVPTGGVVPSFAVPGAARSAEPHAQAVCASSR
jgi:hypothetical protein